jgi:hypothetical protein
MKRTLNLFRSAASHPRLAAMGAREFRLGFGMSWDDPDKSDAYDAGRELAHIATARKFDGPR